MQPAKVFSIGITLVGAHLDWFHFLVLKGRLLAILIDFIFFVTVPRCYKDVYVISFFPRLATLWNPLNAESFSLTYDLHCSKSRVNRHLFSLGSF